MAEVAAHGSWRSIIESGALAASGRRISQPCLVGDFVYWLEGRPSEGGRQVIVRCSLSSEGAAPEDVSAQDVNVRSRVHEYGGGDFVVARGVDHGVEPEAVYFVNFADQRLYEQRGHETNAIGPEGRSYADPTLSPDGAFLVVVEETPREGQEPENRLVYFRRLPGGRWDGSPRVAFSGTDFVSAPCFSPSGDRLAFTSWNHPDMPWDSTRLMELSWGEEGPASAPRMLAGGGEESILQPSYSPRGVLTFLSDRSGYWNVQQWHEGGVRPLHERAAEFGGPQWVFGLSWFGFIDEDQMLCTYRESKGWRLARLDVQTGHLEPLELPFTDFGYVGVENGRACFMGGNAVETSGIHVIDLSSGQSRCVARSSDLELEPDWLSVAESLRFASVDGRDAYAYFYAPKNPRFTGPSGERPPLLVKSHGGPTAAASASLDPRIQYWTSRGFAVLDVDYAGSTGYGRAYRQSLAGGWGVKDVEDCIAAARFVAGEGWADEARMAISGGSAGGYTTLCALTFHDVFAAGASHYGIGDLEALVRDTHKFEARYMDRLVGPYPERADVYRERSPIHFSEKLSCPVIFFQGLDDRVVPPNQSQAMAVALANRGVAYAYVAFEGEQHGFRQAKNICTALDGEAYFYGRVFGFETGVHPPEVEIVDGQGLASA